MIVETRAILAAVGYFTLVTGWSVSVRVIPAPWPFWSAVGLLVLAVVGAVWCLVMARRPIRARPTPAGKALTAAELTARLEAAQREEAVPGGRHR